MLSKRLAQIYDLVKKNSVVYDVGSDHAFLACALVKNGKCPLAYAGDNKIGPLENAKKNIHHLGLDTKVIPSLYDGIDPNIKADVIVLAGMGFYTVQKILSAADLRNYQEIIVQVNQDVPKLRSFISELGYKIINEKVVFDGFYYEIVVFDPKIEASYTAKECYLGPILMKERDEVYLDSLRQRKKSLEDIFKRVQSKHDPRMTYYKWICEVLNK